ncbi:MAG: glycosyltransferase [Spirochaetia bacterium]
METASNLNILITHFRVGRTDGVSLEIEKRKHLLQEMGHQVSLLSGPLQNGANYIIQELEFDVPEYIKLRKNSITKFEDYESEEELLAHIHGVKDVIKTQLKQILEENNFDMIFAHNILSLAIHMPATLAFVELITEMKIPCMAIDHDFYWEGDITTIPQFDSIGDLLKKYFVPDLPNVRHATINTLNEKHLAEEGVEADVNYDVFAFDQPAWQPDDFNADFRKSYNIGENDIIVLQATRIVPNKAIEVAMDYVKVLQNNKDLLIGSQLYNGREFTKDSNIVFLLAGYAEEDRMWYMNDLEDYAKKLGIDARFIGNSVGYERNITESGKIYSLWDTYVFSDIVTYPSIWEGWGNQFIEAVFAKKPVVVFEYPVYAKDIRPEGYKVISLGDVYTQDESKRCKVDEFRLEQSMYETVTILTDRQIYRATTDMNFYIGEKNHSRKVLRKYLQDSIEWASGWMDK